MRKFHNEQTNTICRYLVIHTMCENTIVSSTWKTRELAKKQAASDMQRLPHFKYFVRKYVMYPNQTISDFGIERFDSMITYATESELTLVGTRAELVNSGVIGDYVFDQLGKSGVKRGCDEFGNNYRLAKKGKSRFELEFEIFSEPQKPYGMAKADPYKTDITEILERISAT